MGRDTLTDDLMDFRPWPKIARLNRPVIVTEKLDGTNAQVIVARVPAYPTDMAGWTVVPGAGGMDMMVRAASRKRLITPEDDNFGFAGWVRANAALLVALGEGRHYGEWWGLGIQRGYGLTERRFSLFNTTRWADNALRPECCGIVPILEVLPTLDYAKVTGWMTLLRSHGSYAAPFMNPEGVVAHHTASGQSFKWTYEADEGGKEQQVG